MASFRPLFVGLSIALGLAAAAGCALAPSPSATAHRMASAAAAGWTPAKAEVALGARLFFDPRLSRTGKVACGTCHVAKRGFTEAKALATGVDGRQGGRNTPTVLGAAAMPALFWDGRARTMEEQALGPIANPKEMDADPDVVAAKLAGIEMYARLFDAAYAGPPTKERMGRALAAFERALKRTPAAYDRWKGGDATAVPAAAVRGAAVFERARCASCHGGADFTDHGFKRLGWGDAADEGRSAVTHDPADRGRFKTPSLRDVADTGPYFHDGKAATLAEAVDFHLAGGGPGSEVAPVKLAAGERDDLLAFLGTLSGGHNLKALVPDLVEPK